MEFKFLDEILKHNLNLQFSDLEVLGTNSASFEVLLYQHGGKIVANNGFIGNDASNAAPSKFRDFFRLAKNENVALAITPEYSCPWVLMKEIVENADLQPTEGKLWAIGCESISKEEIKEFRSSIKSTKDIVIYFDDSILSSGKTFLNPLCYIFRAKDDKCNWVTVLVFQFKTQHCGVWATEPIESNNLILGKEVYVLRNDQNSINLFTLICSDVEQFDVTTEFQRSLSHTWQYNPYLILNIQLNPKPRHEVFRRFRNKVFDHYDKKEIISLNWATETFGNGTYPSSSLYMQSAEFNMDENVLVAYHQKGLYYTYKRQNYQCIYFNSASYIFKIRHSKLAQGGTHHSMTRRGGPGIIDVYKWDLSHNKFNKETILLNDGFMDCLDSISCTINSLKSNRMNVLDKERLLNISNGKVDNGNEWHKLNNLITFKISELEHIYRLTFAQDQETKDDRFKYIEHMRMLNDEILTNPALFPESLLEFRGNCDQVMFFEGANGYSYAYNLVTKDKKYKATVAYVGISDIPSAERAFKDLKIILIDSQDWRKVVVWYKHDGVTKFVWERSLPSINDQANVDPTSITKEK